MSSDESWRHALDQALDARDVCLARAVKAEAEVARLRAGVQEEIQDAREQAVTNEEGFSYRAGNNLFNGGAAQAQRDIADALEALLKGGSS